MKFYENYFLDKDQKILSPNVDLPLNGYRVLIIFLKGLQAEPLLWISLPTHYSFLENFELFEIRNYYP